MTITISTHESIKEIPASEWDAFIGSPFVSHAFLRILEDAKCVGGDTGWIPVYIVARDEEQTFLGALPFFLKLNSSGEFVFDWSWADAAQNAGIAYYPKGLVASPFSPVPGERLLTKVGDWETKAALIEGVLEVMVQMGLSSVHFNFLRTPDLEALEKASIPIREGIQYHWYNIDPGGAPYETYDAYLAAFRSKRRANLRRERRKLKEQGVCTQVLLGDEITEEHSSKIFAFYLDTVNKFHWGRQYLNETFFQMARCELKDQLHFVFALLDDEIYAGAFNLYDEERLYGRYWGCSKDIDYTHFEVCMYTPIEWCIEKGIQVFEPGAGGEHKFERGFTPTRTYSAHVLRHPGLNRAVVESLDFEKKRLVDKLAMFRKQSPLKTPGF